MKGIFEFIFDQFQLVENPIYNYIGMLIIAIIASIIAWKVSPGGRWGSLINLIVNIFVTAVLFAIISSIIWIIKLILLVPMWGWVLALIFLVAISAALLIIKQRKLKISDTNRHE